MSIKVREKDVEGYLVQALERIGIRCLKFDPSNRIGMPDRIVLLPGGKVIWVELKTDNGKVKTIQELRHRELEGIGHRVEVIWNKEDVDRLIGEIEEELQSC